MQALYQGTQGAKVLIVVQFLDAGKILVDYQYRTARRVRLRSEQPVPVQADGDPAGVLPVSVEVVPGALSLVVAPDLE